MHEHHCWYDGSVWHIDWPYILWSSEFASYVDYLLAKFCIWDNGSVWLKDRPCNICGSVTYISWSIDFTFYHCHRLKLFLYIKKCCWLGVFVSLQALALVRNVFYWLNVKTNSFEIYQFTVIVWDRIYCLMTAVCTLTTVSLEAFFSDSMISRWPFQMEAKFSGLVCTLWYNIFIGSGI